jgi:hypothetical protein
MNTKEKVEKIKELFEQIKGEYITSTNYLLFWELIIQTLDELTNKET